MCTNISIPWNFGVPKPAVLDRKCCPQKLPRTSICLQVSSLGWKAGRWLGRTKKNLPWIRKHPKLCANQMQKFPQLDLIQLWSSQSDGNHESRSHIRWFAGEEPDELEPKKCSKAPWKQLAPMGWVLPHAFKKIGPHGFTNKDNKIMKAFIPAGTTCFCSCVSNTSWFPTPISSIQRSHVQRLFCDFAMIDPWFLPKSPGRRVPGRPWAGGRLGPGARHEDFVGFHSGDLLNSWMVSWKILWKSWNSVPIKVYPYFRKPPNGGCLRPEVQFFYEFKNAVNLCARDPVDSVDGHGEESWGNHHLFDLFVKLMLIGSIPGLIKKLIAAYPRYLHNCLELHLASNRG